MVQCDACSKWYHTMCIGVGVKHFDDEAKFYCCQTQVEDEQFEYVLLESTSICVISEINHRVVSSVRGKRRSILKMTDIKTLWPNGGISDAVIDFFVW